MVATVLAAFNGNMAQPRTRNNVLSIMRRFSVTRNAPQLVSPSEPTPSGSLPLSATDNRPYFNTYEQTVHVYRHGREPAKVIKEALSRALVPYYPVAGRLRRSEHGNLEVDCTDNGGIGFVEASADCSLEDVNHFVDPPPLVIPAEQLLPTDVEKHQPIFLMQAGLAQFMNAVGEISASLPQP
ncbi:uncharacterized protein A4U43_C03F4080 [Asparagus officinalis]|uniref:Uncharacterized protein n=1 Tax=Asparagus officinalis TaxID=4686 RepID=A0A5P1F762_ASPOF|nr:uncharacterized protein A4U43_C03F4080 [Asparagus officinalis]